MRKMILTAFVMGMVITITGCGIGNDNKTKSTANNEGGSVAVDKNKSEESSSSPIEEKEGELKILSESGDSYDTKEGRYYLAGDEDQTIRYIDYKTKKEVYLCNKLNCKHDNKNCTALLPNQELSVESFLFGDGKYIYILTTPYGGSDSMEVSEYNEGVEEGIISVNSGESNEPPAIYRMNQDGTGREKVFEFESGVIAEQNVMGDEKYLYVVTVKNKSETKGNTTYKTTYDRKLVKLDLEKGTSEEIMELKNGQDIIGCSGRNLIVSKDDFGKELSSEEKFNDDKYKKLYENSKCIISSINIDSNQETKLKSIKNSNDKLHGEVIYGDKLYISYEGEKFIEIQDLKSGETKKLKLNDSYAVDKIISVENKPDMMIGTLYSEYGKGEKGWSDYLINLETGEVTKSTLQTRYKTPISIEGENEEYLYVMNDYKNETEYVSWVDVYQEAMSEVEYSIISKKDYVENKPNFKKIKLLNGGKLKDED